MSLHLKEQKMALKPDWCFWEARTYRLVIVQKIPPALVYRLGKKKAVSRTWGMSKGQ